MNLQSGILQSGRKQPCCSTHRLRRVVSVWLLCGVATTQLLAQSPLDATPETSNVESIDHAMGGMIERGEMVGAVTFVLDREGYRHLGAVGKASIDPPVAMKKETLFAIASMTKPITAVATMQLVEQGKLSLEDPVSKYIPAFAEMKLEDGSPVRTQITIFHLLTHTSGLTGSHWVTGSLGESVEQMARRPLAFRPGERWQYGPGLNACGRVVEIISGEPFDEYLDRHLFGPLKMNDTTFFPDDEQRSRLATIYRPGTDRPNTDPRWIAFQSPNEVAESDIAPSPSAGLFSTAGDLAKFYFALLHDGGGIIRPATLREMTTIRTGKLKTGFTPGCAWGLGVCVVASPTGVTEMLSAGTFGHGGAYGTQGWIDPAAGRVYGLLIQRTRMGNSDASGVRRMFQSLAAELE